jgi:hypothetical protein
MYCRFKPDRNINDRRFARRNNSRYTRHSETHRVPPQQGNPFSCPQPARPALHQSFFGSTPHPRRHLTNSATFSVIIEASLELGTVQKNRTSQAKPARRRRAMPQTPLSGRAVGFAQAHLWTRGETNHRRGFPIAPIGQAMCRWPLRRSGWAFAEPTARPLSGGRTPRIVAAILARPLSMIRFPSHRSSPAGAPRCDSNC